MATCFIQQLTLTYIGSPQECSIWSNFQIQKNVATLEMVKKYEILRDANVPLGEGVQALPKYKRAPGGDGPEDDEVAELLQIGPALSTPFNKTAQHPV